MSNLKEDRGDSLRSKTGKTAKKLPNNSSSKSSGQERNDSQEPKTIQQALINLLPRDFYSFLFGAIAVICLYNAITTRDMTLLWSVWAAVGFLVGIAPRARQGFNWAKDHYELQVKDPSETSLIE
jgi:hypothetical protein